MAILCAVGENLRVDPALAIRMLAGLDGVPLRMVSQAASRRNVTVVLRDARRRGGDGAAARRLVRGSAAVEAAR